MNRQDRFFLLLGPCAILAIWILLPWGRSEAWSAGAESSPAIVELVGYAFEAPAGGSPALLGRGAEAGFRLHSAPVAPRAVWLEPPDGDGGSWSMVPAGAGLTLRLLGLSAQAGETALDSRVADTSVRPWRRPRGVLSRFLPPPAEPIVVGCGEGTQSGRTSGATTVAPEPLTDDWPGAAALPGAWAARLTGASEDGWLLPWGQSSGPRGLWLSMNGPTPGSIRIGVAGTQAGGDVETLSICAGAGDSPAERLAMIGPLEARDGDVLAIGRTRFLVRADTLGSRPIHRLELHHVRQPDAPGYFRASARHPAYHPNRRALWGLPGCEQAGETLTLAVEPTAGPSEDVGAADLAARDRRRLRQIEAAARDHDRPHELPAVASGRVVERALLSLCTIDGAARGELGVRLVADAAGGIGLSADAAAGMSVHESGERTVPIGSAGRPRELLVDLEGNLLRVAPAAGPWITRRTRAGLAVFLVLVLGLQGWLLTLARIERRRRAARRGAARRGAARRGAARRGVARRGASPPDWPIALATPTLQQVAGIAIVSLLFLGVSFHLFLGLHPDLVGKPDYLQAFLQGTVLVCVVLAAGAGASRGRTLERRLAAMAASAAATLLAAAGWWWLDGAGSAEGAWYSAWRDRASASAGATPEATGKLLAIGAGLSAAAAAALYLSARLRWSRGVERLARFAVVRAPLAGFAAIAGAGLALGLLQRSALAFELAIVAGLAWYGAVYWAFVRHGRLIHDDGLRRRAAVRSMAAGLLMLLFLAVFFVVGADLPDALSFVAVAAGLGISGLALRIARGQRSTSLLRMVGLWSSASILGMAFASFVLTDMGSVAAWVPALLTGFFLWLVRPEEIDSRREEPRKALSHLLLAAGAGLVLLGLLDVFKVVVERLDWRLLERPRQRLALAEDISYITSGEWITQVRWLASQHDDTLHWVPNANSDVAIFGLAANLGFGWAVIASLLLLTVAGCAALAADLALREARAATRGGDRLKPVLYRAFGLTLGMIGVLLICQWLVHLATGVVLHLPITGLVFPWLSHGNTTHLLYAAAILLPMAAVTALGARPSLRGDAPSTAGQEVELRARLPGAGETAR